MTFNMTFHIPVITVNMSCADLNQYKNQYKNPLQLVLTCVSQL